MIVGGPWLTSLKGPWLTSLKREQVASFLYVCVNASCIVLYKLFSRFSLQCVLYELPKVFTFPRFCHGGVLSSLLFGLRPMVYVTRRFLLLLVYMFSIPFISQY